MVREFYTNAWVTYKHVIGVNPEPKNWHTMWMRDSKGKPYLLGRHDLKPIARRWLESIQRSIHLTSNCSEVTVEQTVMIHCIMLSNEVEVHEVIPQEFYRIADKSSTTMRLAFSHIIYRLCAVAGAHIDRDTPIGIERPITKKDMEHARELGQGPQQEPVLPPPQDLPKMP
ncbi:hypothetical protein AHAS_Ahas20G0276200 [Arachis hypogaea]